MGKKKEKVIFHENILDTYFFLKLFPQFYKWNTE